MNRESLFSTCKNCSSKCSSVPVLPILVLLFFLNSCKRLDVQGPALTITPIPSGTQTLLPKPTLTLTTEPTIRHTETPQSISTSTPVPNTPTPTPKPFLISYTYYSDGGDELWRCLLGASRPTFILYTDGLLVFLDGGQYWQAILPPAEINVLIEKLSSTGLFQLSEKEYNNGNNQLIVNGKSYYIPSVTSDSNPVSQALDIIYHYQPKNAEKFIPDRLLLAIYRVDNLEDIKRLLPQPTPVVGNWEDDPLSQYGEVWKIISGGEVPAVMAQFNRFPDFKLLKQGNTYYVASICADYPYP